MVVLDEAVPAPSMSAYKIRVLDLLIDLQRGARPAYLFIS